MPKAARRSSKKSTSSPGVVCTERPRRSARVKTQNTNTNNTKPRPNRTNRRMPRTRSQPLYIRSAAEANSDPNRRLPLFQLPIELLKHIASTQLPLESAVSLTLTCKEALSTIGTWPWAAFKKQQRWSISRTNLFSALYRDWQSENATNVDLDLCKRCNTLHPALKPPSQHRRVALTAYCFGQDACIDYLPRREDDDTCSTKNNEDRGWSLVLPHILEALTLSSSHSQKGQSGPRIPLLSSAFSTTFLNTSVRLHLATSARRVDGNLLVRHDCTFQKAGLNAKDILDLKIYLCPHQCSTRTGPALTSRYISSEGRNSPLFTHAINSAFPKTRQARISDKVFRKPTSHEQRNMDEAKGQKAPLWNCRSCSTKYRVELVGNADLRIVVWRCFGRDELHARKYWRFFVRREGAMLGRDKRNDEWWSPTGMGVVEFDIGE